MAQVDSSNVEASHESDEDVKEDIDASEVSCFSVFLLFAFVDTTLILGDQKKETWSC